jgi:hypothetical protein
MPVSRRLLVIAFCCAIAQGAAAGPSLAPAPSEPVAAPGSGVVWLAARKGTRNYVPGEESGTEQALQETSPAQSDQASEEKALEDCIAIWDTGTHISKSKWREVCRRQIKERGAQHSGH